MSSQFCSHLPYLVGCSHPIIYVNTGGGIVHVHVVAVVVVVVVAAVIICPCCCCCFVVATAIVRV